MRSVTKTEAAFDELRRAILTGNLEPGRRLPVGELIEMLEMSPTPIREALRLLQVAGLVDHEPHHGMVVRFPTATEDEDVVDLRVALEPLAAAKAAEQGTDDQLAEINDRHTRWRGLADRRPTGKASLQRVATAHREMLLAVYAASNSDHLVDFVQRLWESLPEEGPPSHDEGALDAQSAVIEAIQTRDSAGAHTAMRAYLTETLRPEDRLVR